jgi:ribosomal protein S18 acetylase RimI-like enzyme
MNVDLRRAFEFLASGDMAGARTGTSRFGLAVYDDELPLRHDSNYLLVDRLPGTVSTDDLIGEAQRLDRPAIFVRDEQTGDRLAPAAERQGWSVHRGLVMASRRQPERTPATHLVHEVGETALRPARRQQLAGEPWATPDVIAQLLDAKLAIARVLEACFFAVLVDGQVVSYVDLYSDGHSAQIEDLATLKEHRGRGYASALVLHALAQARLTGCDLVFLVADAEDWPKELYRRLGFDDIGRYVKLTRPAEPAEMENSASLRHPHALPVAPPEGSDSPTGQDTPVPPIPQSQ